MSLALAGFPDATFRNATHAVGHDLGFCPGSHLAPIVFVIDDDNDVLPAVVRPSLERVRLALDREMRLRDLRHCMRP